MQILSLLTVLSLVAACGSSATPSGADLDAGPRGDATVEVDEDSLVAQYIRSTTYSKLILEVDSVPGFEPRAASESQVIGQLEQILDKPAGISAVRDGTLLSRGADHGWTNDELFALADETFDLAVADDTVKMHVLYVDGHSARDTSSSRILGVAWSNQHLVMFKQSIEETCTGPLTPPLLREALCESAEFAIWLHEIGHIIGLVNTGLAMVTDHQDEEHGAHDINDNCVMYWAYEGDAAVDQLRSRLMGGNEETLAFDDECLADIAAVRTAP